MDWTIRRLAHVLDTTPNKFLIDVVKHESVEWLDGVVWVLDC